MPDTADTTQQDRKDRDDELLAALLALAVITDDDLASAEGMWEQQAPNAYRTMLTGDGLYDFDEATQRYRRRDTGHLLAPDAIKRISLVTAGAISDHILKPDAARMASGEVDLDTWAMTFARDIKDAAIAMGALAAGGFDELDEKMRGLVLGVPDAAPGLSYNLTKLAGFVNDVREHEMSEGAITNRAGYYADALGPLFETVRRQKHIDARDEQGRPRFLYERNVLGQSEHCSDSAGAPGCLEVTAEGWQPIGTLPEIGSRTCVFRCRCSWGFSLTGGLDEEM